jgi:predicted HicB family RNase H-like nuclease
MKKPVSPLTDVEIRPAESEAPTDQFRAPPAREGRVALTLRIEPELHRRLRTRAFQSDTTIQDIILEALARMGV